MLINKSKYQNEKELGNSEKLPFNTKCINFVANIKCGGRAGYPLKSVVQKKQIHIAITV